MQNYKTLKDIKLVGSDGVEDEGYVKELLRAEAVKWYKKIKRFEVEDFDKNTGTLKFIKHFFNLTEEDLK